MGGFIWAERTHTRGNNPIPTDFLSITVKQETRVGKNRNPARMSVAFYQPVIKLTRWIKGDRVVIGYDKDAGLIAIRRVANGGYALTTNGGGKASKTLRTSCGAPRGLTEMTLYRPTPGDVQLIDGMLVISLPKGE